MAVFGVMINDSAETKKFFAETAERLKGHNLITNPFIGTIRKVGSTHVIDMEPIHINYPKLIVAPLTLFSIVIFGFRGWFHVPMVIISGMWIFWSRHFFCFMLKKGLKKAGYTGPVKMIGPDEIIRKEVLVNGTRANLRFFKRKKTRD